MNPFIVDPFQDGRYVLGYQIENSTSTPLREAVLGASINKVAIPKRHSLKAAWIVRLAFDNNLSVEFSSACTDIGNWREIGSLNINIFSNIDNDPESFIFDEYAINDFRVAALDRLVYEEENLFVENGIVFSSEKGEEIWIAAAPAPGSVTVQAPFSIQEFSPEFSAVECRRIRI